MSINKNDFKCCGPFKLWTIENFPFIEADFDAITNYQLYSKIVEYVRKIAENQNALNNSYNELIEAFNNLESYVTNYFENLDVQEEINNKLDDMAESGELESIISLYLNSIAIFGFDNVASMKSSTKLVNGSYAETLGYYSKNDGGSALYKIRNITNDDVVDEKFIIEIGDSGNELIAELIVKNDEVNVLQVGGKNDNSTDTGTLINYITNTKGYKCYVPKGSYNVNTTINPVDYSFITIDGNLYYTGNDSCIKIDGHSIYLKTENIETTDGICVLLENNNASESKCSNNKLFFNGRLKSTNNHVMYLHSILKGICYNEIHFDTLTAGSSKYCIYIKTESENSSVAKYVNENIFYGGRCSQGLYGIYIDTNTSGSNGECNGLKFYNVCLEGITNGIYLNNARANLFEFPRVAEISNSNKIITLSGTPDGNIFNINSIIKSTSIDLTNLTSNSLANFINGEIVDSGGTRIARNFITYKQRLQIERLLSKFRYINISNALVNDGEVIFDSDKYANFILVTASSNPIITLNQYYGSRGLNDLIIKHNDDNAFTLKDNYNNTIYTSAGTGTGNTVIKHYICYDLNGVDTWLEI